jgi:hypothetical protein
MPDPLLSAGYAAKSDKRNALQWATHGFQSTPVGIEAFAAKLIFNERYKI